MVCARPLCTGAQIDAGAISNSRVFCKTDNVGVTTDHGLLNLEGLSQESTCVLLQQNYLFLQNKAIAFIYRHSINPDQD